MGRFALWTLIAMVVAIILWWYAIEWLITYILR